MNARNTIAASSIAAIAVIAAFALSGCGAAESDAKNSENASNANVIANSNIIIGKSVGTDTPHYTCLGGKYSQRWVNATGSDIAAHVGNFTISKSDAEMSLDSYRTTYGLEDDDNWAQALVNSGYDSQDAYEMAVKGLAQNYIIQEQLESYGVSFSDEAVEQWAAERGLDLSSDDVDLFEVGQMYRKEKSENTANMMYEHGDLVVSGMVTDEDILESAENDLEGCGGVVVERLLVVDSKESAEKVVSEIRSGIDPDTARLNYIESLGKDMDKVNKAPMERLTSMISIEEAEEYSGCEQGGVTILSRNLNEKDPNDITYFVSIVESYTPIKGEFNTISDLPEKYISDKRQTCNADVIASAYNDWLAAKYWSLSPSITDIPSDLKHFVDVSEVYKNARSTVPSLNFGDKTGLE